MNSMSSEAIVFDTPLGAFRVDALGERIVAAAFCDQPLQGNNLHVLKVAEKQFKQFFDHERKRFQLPLAPRGTVFQQRVWLALERLDFGQTCTYGDLAQQLGNPRNVSAVAQAVGRNPIAVAIPCHRVLGRGGKLTGYTWGTERKEWLLQLERSAIAA